MELFGNKHLAQHSILFNTGKGELCEYYGGGADGFYYHYHRLGTWRELGISFGVLQTDIKVSMKILHFASVAFSSL